MPEKINSKKNYVSPKIMLIEFRPDAIPVHWGHAENLASDYIAAMRKVSRDTLIYQVVDTNKVNTYPILEGGRLYDNVTWSEAWKNDSIAYRDSGHNYLFADYQLIIQEFDIFQKIKAQSIDEVWMFGAPYFGFYESRMVGKNAFWCNAPAIELNCRKFVIMGFNYERSVKEMLHDFGHRSESILSRQFGSQPFLQKLYSGQKFAFENTAEPKNEFEQFLKRQGTVHRFPGGAEYGQDEVSWLQALKTEWFSQIADPNLVK